MKNIILMGSSRSGKTTLSRMIKNINNKYNVLHGDMIKKSFQSYSGREASDLKNDFKYRKFIFDIFNNHSNFDDDYYVIETVDIFPEDLINYDLSNTLVIALGCTSNSSEELIDIWNKIDTKWLKNKTNDELKIKAKKVVDSSNFFKNECCKYNIKFIDTSYNREEVLNKIVNEIYDDIN